MTSEPGLHPSELREDRVTGQVIRAGRGEQRPSPGAAGRGGTARAIRYAGPGRRPGAEPPTQQAYPALPGASPWSPVLRADAAGGAR